MMYDVVDTCGMKRKDREALYNIGFSFRREKILKILDENAAKLSKAQKEELEWQLSALEKIRLLFNDNNFWYSNVLYIAFANKG